MADLQTIAQHLRGMAAGIERTQHAAAAADARAEEIAQRAMMTGLAGIAMGVQQLRMSMSEVRQRLMNIGRSVSEAASPVAGAAGSFVVGKGSPEEAAIDDFMRYGGRCRLDCVRLALPYIDVGDLGFDAAMTEARRHLVG